MLFLAGCSKKEEDAILPADPAQLVGNWILVSPNTGYNITLTIEPTVNNTMITPPTIYRISGKGPVNQYGGVLNYAPYSVTQGPREIRVDSVARGSKIGETSEQEQVTDAYFRKLSEAYIYTVQASGELHLIYGASNGSSTSAALVFKRQ